MANVNRYVTGMILAAAIVVFGGFFFLHGAVRTIRHSEFDMSYNMPRPKSALYNFFFGLEGREIDRQEINPFKDKAAKVGAGSVRKDAPKIQAAAKQATAQKQVAKGVVAAAHKAEVKVNVVNAAPESTPGSGSDSANTQTPGATAAQNTPATVQTGTPNEKDADKLSAAQWRAMVLGQPTKENVMKLVNAFNNKEADAATLYLIMNDLMQSSNADTQSLGLLIGQSVPSLRSFSIVSENYEKMDATGKKNSDAYFATYMQSSRLGILALALQSDNNQVVYHAAQTMVTGLEKVKNGPGTVADGSRYDNGRGVVAAGTGKTYTQFVAILQNLITTGDSSVVGLAQNALTQIQSLSNT